MFKVPDHQVAGHKADSRTLGPLIDDSGHFYKPLQNDERGSHEVEFYKSFLSNTSIPDHIRKFFPIFQGTQLIQASDGSGLKPHLVLQDIVSSYNNPCIIDIKIGSRTWYPQASEKYIQKCLVKDKESSSVSLGFRLSGLQVYNSQKSGYWKAGKKLLQKLSVENVKLVLRKFVSSNTSQDSETDPDCSFVSSVYGGSSGILAQLKELKAWFEDQTIFHFYSCSVLIVYEKEPLLKGKRLGGQIKLVDFAHVVDANDVIDHNFLGGICSLIKMISDVVKNPYNYSPEARLPAFGSNFNSTDVNHGQ